MKYNKYYGKHHEKHWIVLFIAMQFFFCVLVNWIIRPNNKLDSLETLTWGQMFQLGYFKHPPLAPWVSATFYKIVNSVDLSIYMLSQICVASSFIALYLLARNYVDKTKSSLAVLFLAGLLFYSQRVEVFNQDTMQYPLWGFLCLFVYLAVQRTNLLYWIISGIFSGLSILNKYQAFVLLFAIGIAIITTKKGRQSLISLGPSVALIICVGITFPHFLWAYQHKFQAVGYISNTYLQLGSINIQRSINFIINSLGNCLPFFLLFFSFYRRSKLSPNITNLPQKQHDQTEDTNSINFKISFLYCIALIPFCVTVLIGLFIDSIPSRWANAYFTWLPLLFLVNFKHEISQQLFKKTSRNCIIVFILLCSLRAAYIIFLPLYDKNYILCDEFVPYKAVAQKISNEWQTKYNTKLKYISAEHYDSVCITAYLQGGTIAIPNLSLQESLWVNKKDFQQQGGVVIINPLNSQSLEIRDKLKVNYPNSFLLDKFSFTANTFLKLSKTQTIYFEFYIIPPLK